MWSTRKVNFMRKKKTNIILYLKKKTGLSSAELARVLGLDKGTVSKIERNILRPGRKTLLAVLEFASTELRAKDRAEILTLL